MDDSQPRKFQKDLNAGLVALVLLAVLERTTEDLYGYEIAKRLQKANDAEEYLRAEVAAHPDKSESDVLELIASTYGAPDEVAAAYRDTEAKVKAALKTPTPRAAANASGLARFFAVYQDPRAYTSLFYMLLTLATGIVYFTFVVTGLSLSAGFAVLIIGEKARQPRGVRGRA